ncbi:MANSC domain-containing protein 1 [Hyperolius riggenbachi]|uniref:MANSC domain-containing protein 1 n=1 Tax=Hyperolius riggenbachi TaxID=752182 RepID=UPI0035A3BC95
MFVSAPCLPRALLFSTLLWISAAFPSSEECKPNSLPDMKIDIRLAVAKGVRFTDPINAANEEECVTACCMEQSSAGGRDCNLAVFDTRTSSKSENCYMFLCPEPEACPMVPIQGVLSYSLWTENPSMEKNGPDLDDGHLKTSKSKSSGKVQSKKPAPAIHSAFAFESDSEEEPISNQKGSDKPSPVHPQSKTDEVKHLDLEGGEDHPRMGQSSSGKKPDPNIHSSYPAESLEEPSHHDLVEQSSQPKFQSQSRTTETKLPTNQDDDMPDHITSQLLNLAENIEKQLGKIATKPEQGRGSDESSMGISDLPMSPESGGVPSMKIQPKDSKKLPLDTKKSKPSKVVEDNSESLEIDYQTLDHQTKTTSDRTTYKVTTTVPKPFPHTKPSFATFKGSKVPIKVPSSETKNTKIASSHHSANASNTATVVKNVQTGNHTTTEQTPTSKTTHQTKFVRPETRHDFALTLPSKGTNSTLKIEAHPFSSKDMKSSDQSVPKPDCLEQKDTSATAVVLKEVPQNLDARGTPQNYSDKSGLVAALIFGVVFLVVVIGLVTRKVSEARRRHQYTKLDYLINGMYVDT